MQPRLLVIEAVRIFDAEASALVGVFASKNYSWRVLSNDPLWLNPSWPTKESIDSTIDEFNPTFVHFALHGGKTGLILTIPEIAGIKTLLSWQDIETMLCWKDRIVITGACEVLPYANSFLRAGSIAVVAPTESITWDRLCHFLRILYSNILDGQSLSNALASAIKHGNKYYGEYECFGIIGNKNWTMTEGI